MLQAYIDVSAKGDARLLVMAGFIARAEVWAEFSTEWQKRLNEARIPYFKMTEWANRPEIAGYFYRTLADFDISAAVSCVVHTKDLYQLVPRHNDYDSLVWGSRTVAGSG
jgi:hypothetical protein